MSPVVVYDLFVSRHNHLFPKHTVCPVGRSGGQGDDNGGNSVCPVGRSGSNGDVDGGNSDGDVKVEQHGCTIRKSESQYFDTFESLPSLDLLSLDSICLPSVVEINGAEDGPLDHLPPTKPGFNAAMQGINFLPGGTSSSAASRFPVIFDSGASIAITGDRNDFVGTLQAPPPGLTIGGMARGAKVEGIGLVKWKFKTSSGAMTLAVVCYYVPACSARLLSPQRLFKKSKGIDGSFAIKEDHAILTINDNPPLIIDYEDTTFLPVGLAWNAEQSPNIIHPSASQLVCN
jgi:hypothetical protein